MKTRVSLRYFVNDVRNFLLSILRLNGKCYSRLISSISPSYIVSETFVKCSELIAFYAKNPIKKAYLLTIKAELFSLHVTSELYFTSKNG